MSDNDEPDDVPNPDGGLGIDNLQRPARHNDRDTISVTDFALPGVSTDEAKLTINLGLTTFSAERGLHLDDLINKLCLFYAIHGTSHLLDPSLTFKMLGGQRRQTIRIGDVAAHITMDPSVTVRSFMRSYADRTRQLLIANAAIRPLLVRKFGYTHRATGFDFADACRAPPLPSRLLGLLLRCKATSVGKDDDDGLVIDRE